ncbi:MAG: hypothetical protein ACE5F2_01360 [Candidatus Paceibacteria bacterium]
MEILLVRESEANTSKIARFLKKRHVRKIFPRNIFIHSTMEKDVSKVAYIIRDVIENKIVHEYEYLVDKIDVFFKKDNVEERDILVTDLDEIKKILKFVKNKYGINFDRRKKIEKGSIISVPINNGNKVAEKIFTL